MNRVIVLAFAAIYLIWGSTYLGIRIAVESMPPFTLTAMRFLAAGIVLYLAGRWSGARKPTSRQWRSAAVIGLCLTTLGNGLVVFAEQRVPSSFAALVVPTVPMWLALLNWKFGERRAPHPLGVLGIVIGFLGMVILSSHSLTAAALEVRVVDVAALCLATFAWACGTVYARQAEVHPSALLFTGMQMLSGTLFLVLLALLNGEATVFNPAQWSLRSLLALIYLIVFGSIIAFSAYTYLTRNVSPYVLGSYAFVNPLIAMLLGWWFYQEPLGLDAFFAAGCIVVGVIFILLGGYKRSLALGGVRQPRRSWLKGLNRRKISQALNAGYPKV